MADYNSIFYKIDGRSVELLHIARLLYGTPLSLVCTGTHGTRSEPYIQLETVLGDLRLCKPTIKIDGCVSSFESFKLFLRRLGRATTSWTLGTSRPLQQ